MTPDIKGFGIIPELDADLLQDGVGITLYQLQALFVEYFEVGYLAGDVGCRWCGRCVALVTPCRSSTTRRVRLFTWVSLIHFSPLGQVAHN